MNQPKDNSLKKHGKASCRCYMLTLDKQSILELENFPIKKFFIYQLTFLIASFCFKNK